MELLSKTINYWVPDQYKDKPALRLRSTVAVAILFFNLVTCALIQIPILFYRSLPNRELSSGHLICLLMLLCYYLALRHFKRRGSLAVASTMICLITFIISLMLTFASGPFPSTLTALFVAPPMMAYLLEGRRAGNRWALLVICSQLVLATASHLELYTSFNVFGSALPAISTFQLVLVTLMVAGAFSLSLHLNEQLQEALHVEKQRLEYLADHDSLTQLHNRRSFETRLDEMAKPMQQRPFALMLLDINQFKRINDSHGHQTGDTVLVDFARQLQQSVRQFDFVARVGGDEFAVILNNLHDKRETARTIALIADRLKHTPSAKDRLPPTRASIGVAIWPGGAANATELYRWADEAMYQSKRQGINFIISEKGQSGISSKAMTQ